MLDDFTQHTSIATSNDQDFLWIRVGVHCQMGNHLLVGELVSLGTLDDIVEDQDSAIVGGLEDQDVLVLALLVVDYLFNFESHSLAGPHLGNLAEPAICVGDISSAWGNIALVIFEELCVQIPH
jgi:hypothetical protein